MTMQTSHEPPLPPSGTLGKLQRLKHDGAYSVAELREFIANMRGRSPQEVLGLVSSSQLIRATVLATFGCIVLMAIFTVIPYALSGAPKVVKSNEPVTPAEAKPAEPVTPVATGVTSPMPDNEPDATKAAKALNLDEVKSSDPAVNPLDKDLDKLLDGK
ncbi:MAG TPA: hypothetical protein VL096_14950 [Pirellulaceae bacterium]|nr:hypothetical protein [Pirellulaceae bacterium]